MNERAEQHKNGETPRAGGPVAADAEAIARAAAVLRAGGLVAFPTETVYGLGANAWDATAAARIFEAKGRPSFDPLIVHAATAEQAWPLAAEVPAAAKQLAAAFWPGPLTLVLAKARPASDAAGADVDAAGAPGDTGAMGESDKQFVPDLVTAGLGTVALRVPGHPVARALIEAAGVPVAAPSANRFGGVSPTRAEHVAAELGETVDLILDGGPCETGVESTVVALTGETPTVLRPGGVAVEAIEQVIGPIAVHGSSSKPGAAGGGVAAATEQGAAGDGGPPRPQAPGMLDRHYAPHARLTLVDSLTPAEVDRQAATAPAKPGLVLFDERPAIRAAVARHGLVAEVLSPTGDLREAAANLFAALRRLDESGAARIVAERVPDAGLGRAINDRLQRAAR
jgi:L-threonylcarbamoyladenylate synthase